MNIRLQEIADIVTAAAVTGILALVGYALLTTRTRSRSKEAGAPRFWLAEKIAKEPVAFTNMAAVLFGVAVLWGLPVPEEYVLPTIGGIIALATWLARRSVTPAANLPPRTPTNEG